MLEIERKFFVQEMPDLSNYSFDEIEQGYLSFKPDIRIRRKGNSYYITKKDEGLLSRGEVETEINYVTYSILSNLVQGRFLQKTRYEIPLYDDFTAELDIYHGDLEGLAVVETEFASESQAKSFVKPLWFGEDITEDEKFKNKNLAKIE